MKSFLLACMMIGAFGASIALGYFVYSRTLRQTPGDTTEKVAYTDTGDTAVLNAVEARVKPANQLEAVLHYGKEIMSGQAFSEGIFEDMAVRQVEVSGNRGTLILEKDGVVVELPVVGVLGLRKTVGGESETVPVRELAAWLEIGERLQARTAFVGSNMSLSQQEIVGYFEENLKGSQYFEEMIEANRLLGVKRLAEDEFVTRLGDNPVIFEPEELITLSVDVME